MPPVRCRIRARGLPYARTSRAGARRSMPPDLESACAEGWDACRLEARAACGLRSGWRALWARASLSSATFSWALRDTLTNLYAHPDEMHALIDYITEYRLTYVRMLIDNLQPDVIFSHDDWGTKNALFMKPEMWREFFKRAVPPLLWLHPLARRHCYPPCRLLSRADRG